MRFTVSMTALLTALALLAPAALAQEEEAPRGELRCDTNAEYAKVTVDGEEWDQVEFDKGGKRAIVKNLDLEAEVIRVTLTPIQNTLGPVTVEVKPKDFARKRGKNRIYYLVATRKVKFPAVKPAEPAPEEPAPEEPTPEDPKPDEGDGDL